MKLGRVFIKDVKKICFEKLAGIGIRRYRSGLGVGIISIAEGFTGWVGLNAATRFGDGCMWVLPNVCLRYDPAHNLIDEIYGRKANHDITPTFGTNVGDLIPGRGSFIELCFKLGEPIEPTADELTDLIEKYGLPYMKKYAHVQGIIPCIKEFSLWDYSGELTLASSYLSGASTQELRKIIDDRKINSEEKKLNDQEFIDFAKNFLEYVETDKEECDGRENIDAGDLL